MRTTKVKWGVWGNGKFIWEKKIDKERRERERKILIYYMLRGKEEEGVYLRRRKKEKIK